MKLRRKFVPDFEPETETAKRKQARADFRELVATTPRGVSLGFARDRARAELRRFDGRRVTA